MLATLERPTSRPVNQPVEPSSSRLVQPPSSAPTLLSLVPPPVDRPEDRPAAVASVTRSAPGRRAGSTKRAEPLRLTARARRLVAAVSLIGAAGVGVIAVDVLSAMTPYAPSTSYAAQEAPYFGSASDAAGPGTLLPAAESTITVTAGDTLWSLAERVDPDADPRDLIAAIMTLNGLSSPAVQPGQVLRVP